VSWSHKWKSLTGNQQVLFVLALLALPGTYFSYASWHDARTQKVPSAPKLTLSASLSNVTYPDGAVYARIEWKKDWREVQLDVTNEKGPAIKNLDVTISGQMIEAIGQITNEVPLCKPTKLLDVTVPNIPGLPSPEDMEEKLREGMEKAHAFSEKWQLSCPEIGGGKTLKAVIAIAFDKKTGLPGEPIAVAGTYEFDAGKSANVAIQVPIKH
jgi:hypothetical protein